MGVAARSCPCTGAMASCDRQVLLPIWHGVHADDVAEYSPSLADKVGILTADRTAEDIAVEVADFIHGVR